MRRTFLLFFVALLPVVTNADSIEIDGIYYNLLSKAKQAEVTSNPDKYTGDVNIPEFVTYEGKEYIVICIGERSFYNCTRLTSVTIGNSVNSIGGSAFYGCKGLTSVIIPNSVKNISNEAFYGCSSLKKVIVPDIAAWCSVSFGSNANPLYYAHHLYSDEETEITDLVIPDGVTSIVGSVFSGCSSLTSVTIPNSLTSIGASAFSGCSGLTSITIPGSVTSIGSLAFYNCYGLTSITIPGSVTSIGGSAFSGCSGLTSITIPSSVTNIGDNAFSNCNGLKKVVVPDIAAWCSVSFGSNANPLYYAHHLYSDEETEITDLIIPNGVTSIGTLAFWKCSGLTSVTIPGSVTRIKNYAFRGCSGLTSVIIPNSVTRIDGNAFAGCSSLTSVTIGSGVRTINQKAFADCQELTDVYCYAENVPSTNEDAFQNSYIEYTTLHVPASAIELYRVKAPWSQFGTVKATDGTIPDPPVPEKCATPTISYANGKLTFISETEGAICQSTITDSDITSYSGNEVQLSVTYTISVYATKTGYENSEVATATLCWINVEPQTEGIIDEDAIAEVKVLPVLIQTQGSIISIQGVAEGTPIAVYDTSGKQYGTTMAERDCTTITTSLSSGSLAVVKIGEKSVKLLLK